MTRQTTVNTKEMAFEEVSRRVYVTLTFFLLMLVLSTDILTNGLPSVFLVVQSELLRFKLMS